ncbi:hypothetical protein KUV73_04060 [Mameliella alba]|nr:hypothetical protein [Mameliella alba]MBY6168501.1 hypothetical protein [Mameliella alba]MBY6173520.1 hypothetical protein [Mameliella alba]
MTSVFDGLAGVLNGVFGAPVEIEPTGEAAYTVQGVFRREPIEVAGAEGEPVLILSPTLRVQRDAVPALDRGDIVRPSTAPGEVFRVANGQDTMSPASDGFAVYELELDE